MELVWILFLDIKGIVNTKFFKIDIFVKTHALYKKLSNRFSLWYFLLLLSLNKPLGFTILITRKVTYKFIVFLELKGYQKNHRSLVYRKLNYNREILSKNLKSDIYFIQVAFKKVLDTLCLSYNLSFTRVSLKYFL